MKPDPRAYHRNWLNSHLLLWIGLLGLSGLLLSITSLRAQSPKQTLALPAPLSALELQGQSRIDLGQMLFFDRRLSGDGTMSCAVCHIPDQAFADGGELSLAYPTNKHWRNTPSLLNTAYLERFFWDGRAASLTVQAAGPLESPVEMNSKLPYLAAKLAETPEYQEAFQRAYAAEVNPELILAALAAFEQTLSVTDSPFERFLTGEEQALSAPARRGLELFFGARGGCSQCHSGPLLTDQKFYNLRVAETPTLQQDPQRRATRRYMLERQGLPMLPRDPGRYLVSKQLAEMGAFRTPPLHQIAQTGPYMHNGSLKTLAEVVAFFSRGGGDDAQRSTLLKVRNFTPVEQADLVTFLESLSGTVPEVHRPHLPGD